MTPSQKFQIVQNAGNHRDLLGEIEPMSSEAPAINLNFTWNITDFRQTSMDLQLYFEEAYYVSTQHSMQVKILIREFFVANQTLKTLTDDNLDLKVVCKPQMQLGPAAAAMQVASDSTDKGTKGILAANFALNILLSSALSLLWGMINGLQIMALLPLANVGMPGNAQMLFNQIYSIAAFNIINVDSITEYIANLLGLEVSSEGVSPRLQAIGFETSNTIMNLGLVFLFFVVSGIVLLVWVLLKALSYINCRKQEKIREWERSLYKKLFWNFFLRLFLETYIDQAFVQALKLRNLKFTPRIEAVSAISAFLIIAALVLSPLILQSHPGAAC